MAGASPFVEAAVLNTYLGTCWASLHTGIPTGGNEVSTSGTGYARQPATFSQSGSEPTIDTNNALIEWAVATASYGTVTYVGIYSAVSAGNLLFYGTVTTPKTVNIGDVARFPASTLTVSMD